MVVSRVSLVKKESNCLNGKGTSIIVGLKG